MNADIKLADAILAAVHELSHLRLLTRNQHTAIRSLLTTVYIDIFSPGAHYTIKQHLATIPIPSDIHPFIGQFSQPKSGKKTVIAVLNAAIIACTNVAVVFLPTPTCDFTRTQHIAYLTALESRRFHVSTSIYHITIRDQIAYAYMPDRTPTSYFKSNPFFPVHIDDSPFNIHPILLDDPLPALVVSASPELLAVNVPDA